MLFRSVSQSRYFANETAEKQLEEAMARAFENYTMGAFRPVGTIAKIFDKIRSFLRKVYTFFNAKGITEEQADIFERILSGEIGNRARQNAANMFGEKQSVVETPVTSAIGKTKTKKETPGAVTPTETQQALETEKIIYNALS